MTERSFIAACWSPHDESAVRIASRVDDFVRTRTGNWRFTVQRPGQLFAHTFPGRPSAYHIDETTLVLAGDIFDYRGKFFQKCAGEPSFAEICCDLATSHWGSYIALELTAGQTVKVFRDPIGMADCVTWRHGGIRFVASHAEGWMRYFAPASLAIDWGWVATLLAKPSLCIEKTPLCELYTVPPGTIVTLDGGHVSGERLWHARRFYDARYAGVASADALRDIIARCISSWHELHPDAAVEVSGGFDSAVVAALLGQAGGGSRFGVHFFSEDRAGDERRFAHEVAGHCGIALEDVVMPVRPLSEHDMDGMPLGIRPGLGSITLFHDRRMATITSDKGATALFTGHGGDSAFFQHPTPAIGADPSFPRFSFRALDDLARWSLTSIWSVAWQAFHLPAVLHRRESDDAMRGLPLIDPVEPPASNWPGDLTGLPPAKIMQIKAIAGDRAAFGPSFRSSMVTVLHPLLSQPLVEFALGIDTFILTKGKRDRALAREALASVLPPALTDRRGKGALTHYFGRSLAVSVPFLRTFLLDGFLVRNRVLDRALLERMLNRDYLMRYDCYAPILIAMVMEHWVAGWTVRLESSLRRDEEPIGASRPTN